MKFDNHLRYAVQIIRAYAGDVPLHAWLKSFFRDNPQMGSNDRKQVSALVYAYYRLGHALNNTRIEDRILAGMFLLSKTENLFLNYHKSEWKEFVGESLDQKIGRCRQSGIIVEIQQIFPWVNQVSPEIDYDNFCRSFLVQPDLFIRMRPGFEELVRTKLSRHQVIFEELPGSALRLPNTTPVDKILDLNREAVVQDYSSQRTGDFFSLLQTAKAGRAWDCCAASGGKSILLHDRFPEMLITVSDIRESIIANLRKRFSEAGIKEYKAFVADLSKPFADLPELKMPFDLVLMDAPCSGSGTWSRNPEELFFFKERRISWFRQLQEQIFSGVFTKLKPQGIFMYITCSVFQQENEGMVKFIRENSSLQLIQSALVKGYDDKADTLFVAGFKA